MKARINPKSGLCPSCDEFVQGVNRRVDNLDRRHHARDKSHDARRDFGENQEQEAATDSVPPPPGNNVFNFPNLSSSTNPIPLPNIDLNDIIQSCEAAKNGAMLTLAKFLLT